MRYLLLFVVPVMLLSCSPALVRDESAFNLFPTKIDIPFLDAESSVAEISGKDASRFERLGAVQVFRAVYRRTGEDASVSLYVCRAKDSLSAYGMLSSLLPAQSRYSPLSEGYCSASEGVLRRGDLCTYVSASKEYPLSSNDISSILSFVSDHSRKNAEIFPPPVIKFSSKENPLRYSSAGSETFFGLDAFYYGSVSQLPAAGEVFYSERVSSVEASAMLERMLSGRSGDVIVLESSGYDLVCVKERAGSMVFILRRGRIIAGMTKAASLEKGIAVMADLNRVLFSSGR